MNDSIKRQALLARLQSELKMFTHKAREAEEADKAQGYAGDFELTIERLESRGKVMATEWLLHVIEVFEEEQTFTCPSCKQETPYSKGHGDCRACDDCCKDTISRDGKVVYCHPY
jgi:hypothetical protein